MKAAVKNRILLTDDDDRLVDLLSMKLEQLGYKVDGATSAAQGYELAMRNEYDVIILDHLMPKRSGTAVSKDLRDQGVLTPILILSGKTDKTTIVKGLEAGADDYLTKPFSHTELVARLKALTRRNAKTFKAQLLKQSGIELDILSHEARHNDQVVSLTQKETLLLKRLMSDAPRSVPRTVLLHDVWGIGDDHASNRLDVYIQRLRTKLENVSGDKYIHTIRGGGYYFGHG